MGDTSKIEWTEATWNPWHGCIKISPGCKNCYMYTEKKMYGQDPALCVRSKTKFYDPLRWQKKNESPKFCFTCSWSDFFIDTADPWRDEAMAIIALTPEITYQVLTKRIDRAHAYLSDPKLPERIMAAMRQVRAHLGLPTTDDMFPPQLPLPNLWLGASVENQQYANERIPVLLETPAVIRWLSCEPLLGPVDLYETPAGDVTHGPCGDTHCTDETCRDGYATLDWIVVGGESGPKARPMDVAWARQLRDQCDSDGIPFFMKQMGGVRDKRGDLESIPEDLRIRQMPKVEVAVA